MLTLGIVQARLPLLSLIRIFQSYSPLCSFKKLLLCRAICFCLFCSDALCKRLLGLSPGRNSGTLKKIAEVPFNSIIFITFAPCEARKSQNNNLFIFLLKK